MLSRDPQETGGSVRTTALLSRGLRSAAFLLRAMLKPSAFLARSCLMKLGRHHAGSAADWLDVAMAAVVAAMVLGVPLLFVIFR